MIDDEDPTLMIIPSSRNPHEERERDIVLVREREREREREKDSGLKSERDED